MDQNQLLNFELILQNENIYTIPCIHHLHYIQLQVIVTIYILINIYTTVESRYLKLAGTIFYKFKLPKVQISWVIWTCNKVPNAKL